MNGRPSTSHRLRKVAARARHNIACSRQIWRPMIVVSKTHVSDESTSCGSGTQKMCALSNPQNRPLYTARTLRSTSTTLVPMTGGEYKRSSTGARRNFWLSKLSVQGGKRPMHTKRNIEEGVRRRRRGKEDEENQETMPVERERGRRA